MDVVELDAADAEALCDLYEDYEWCTDRDPAEVRQAIDNSITLGAWDDGRLGASARILTDRTYYAKIYDVIVAADERDSGIGEEFMAAVVDHESIADLDPALLCREGLIPFYTSADSNASSRRPISRAKKNRSSTCVITDSVVSPLSTHRSSS
ncbi:GNAT family N-acetyltransferase [Natronomonas sp.]|uniref:GNAT family N-acetyltransferase n=1 Tax=Natronomonas sp. TaxID=2184060 RepID=UPI002FC3DFBF